MILANKIVAPHGQVKIASRAMLPVKNGAMAEIATFESAGGDDGRDHFALLFGGPSAECDIPLVRVHSECVTGDVLGSLRCDCGDQLEEALDRMSSAGGILIYLRQEGRGIGLREKIKAYRLQQDGLDTFEANLALGHPEDARGYEHAAAMLKALGVKRIRLLTRNRHKVDALTGAGIEITEVVPTGVHVNRHNRRYIEAKERRCPEVFYGGQLDPFGGQISHSEPTRAQG